MYCLKIFYSAEEAAEKLSSASTKLKADDIYRLAERGTLPVCFKYRGSIGVFEVPVKMSSPSPLEVVKASFAIAKKKVYFPAGYLRSSNGVQLGAIVEHSQIIKRRIINTSSKIDQLCVGLITVAQAGIGFEGITHNVISEVLWLIGADGQRLRGKRVAINEWLFHIDDLEPLRTERFINVSFDNTNEPLNIRRCTNDVQAKYISSGQKQPKDATVQNPWLIQNPSDPEPVQSWYIPARYFARQLVIEDSTLCNKRPLLSEKVSKMLTSFGIMKRGGMLSLDPNTVLKALSNINFK